MIDTAARRALVVVGMHRSGTSALTRMINLLGAALPAKLLQLDPNVPGETNVLGFWEGLEANTLNNEFMKAVGSRWDSTARIDAAVFQSDAARWMRQRVARHLEADFKDAPLFAIKDPRISRVTPVWVEALRGFAAEPNFIIALRNPLEVAQSLKKRDQMGRGHATLLWLRYMLDAERNTRAFPRMFVSYERLLDNWRGTARRIAEECGFGWPRLDSDAESAIDSFLSSDRRHNLASAAETTELPQWMVDAYGILEQAAEGRSVDAIAVDRIASELDLADDVFDLYLHEIDRERQQIRVGATHLVAELEDVRARHVTAGDGSRGNEAMCGSSHRTIEFAGTDHDFECARALIQDISSALVNGGTEIDQLQAERSRSEAQCQRLADDLAAEQARRADLEARCGEAEAAVDTKSAEVGRLQRELEAQTVLLVEAQLDSARASADRDRHRTEAHRLASDLESQQAQLQDVRRLAAEDCERLKERISALRAERDQLGLECSRLLADLTREGDAHRLAQEEYNALKQRLVEVEGVARMVPVLRRRVNEANDAGDQAREALERKERIVLNANASMAAARMTLATATRRLHAKMAEAETTSAELDAAHRDIAEITRTLERLQSTLEAACHERDDAKAQLERMLASRRWRLLSPGRRARQDDKMPSGAVTRQ